MEAELAALVHLAASTVVGAMATAGWESARRAMGELWRRVHPERADTVVAELEEARADVLAARERGDERAESELVGEWQTRLRRLLAADPELVPELRRIVDELRPVAEQAGPPAGGIRLTANASGRSRVTMAGRDVNITKG
ncbi:hypothetical protein AQJ66_00195 [Streptomyces bungoensis]|uniref:Uncharacterized protein n=1 Tax=Streptomyces bungoensis TaxID=285568 RepID=A0A124I5L1_9ACTN|nr:hypothetical protein [Streptomyces bungoensis]KUN90281.1 hypothetical protein AQJ66_00195 [Streptomyces bungoensis]